MLRSPPPSPPPSPPQPTAIVVSATNVSSSRRTVIRSTISRGHGNVGQRALEAKQEPPPLRMPAVAAEARPGTDDAVARDEELDRAARERAARRAAAAGRAGGGRHVAVRP